MELNLFVKDVLVETLPLDLSKYITCEDRISKVEVLCEWLKYKYARTLRLVPNWRIEMVAESKMNKIP